MPTFDLVVVGAGGGPDETDLSAYVACLLFLPYSHLSLDIYSNQQTWLGATV